MFQRPKPVQEHRNRTMSNFRIAWMQTWSITSRIYSICNTSMWPAFTRPCFTKENFSALIWSRIPHQLEPPSCHQPHLSNHKQHCSRNNLTLNSLSKTFYPKHIWNPLHHPLPCTPPSMTKYIVNTSQCEVPVFFETEQNLWPIEEGPSLTTFCSPPLNCASEKINLIRKLSTFSTKP